MLQTGSEWLLLMLLLFACTAQVMRAPSDPLWF